jgi:hypothetical protein
VAIKVGVGLEGGVTVGGDTVGGDGVVVPVKAKLFEISTLKAPDESTAPTTNTIFLDTLAVPTSKTMLLPVAQPASLKLEVPGVQSKGWGG